MIDFGSGMLGKSSWRRNVKIGACGLVLFVCIHFFLRPPCILGFIPLRSFPKYDGDPRQPSDITVVTAYFNLGRFSKGENGEVFGPKLYLEWASTFEYLDNPLIVYSDSDMFINYFKKIRKNRSNSTQILKVEKSDLWAFNYLEKIREIYKDPNYPHYHPNTVNPEYPCVQNAKYSCLEKALENDHFKTKYYMWLDVGYFRMVMSRKRDFRLVLPPSFDDTKVAMNQVNLGFTMEESPRDIFKKMYVWVGGGLCLAERHVYQTFIKEYRRALEHYLNLKLSNSDQQILFAMSSKAERRELDLKVEIKPYKWHLWGSCWYYLGYQCYREL